jgi:hypothetical protein
MKLHQVGTANRRTAACDELPSVCLRHELRPNVAQGRRQSSRMTNHAEDVICDPNFEGWFRSRSASACAACSLSLAYSRQNSFLRHSTFLVRYSLFVFCSFFPDQTGRFGSRFSRSAISFSASTSSGDPQRRARPPFARSAAICPGCRGRRFLSAE